MLLVRKSLDFTWVLVVWRSSLSMWMLQYCVRMIESIIKMLYTSIQVLLLYRKYRFLSPKYRYFRYLKILQKQVMTVSVKPVVQTLVEIGILSSVRLGLVRWKSTMILYPALWCQNIGWQKMSLLGYYSNADRKCLVMCSDKDVGGSLFCFSGVNQLLS